MSDPEEKASSPLTAEARAALSFQSYGQSPRIDGVSVTAMRKHRAENGWFAEYMRLAQGRLSNESAGSDGMEVRQISVSHADASRINAFHIHPKIPQNELWTVIQGQLTVWLIDCRERSSTRDVRQRVILSAEEPAQLYIPAGVAHGYRAGPAGALLLYAMDQQFEASDPNEGRLPWDVFGAELWEEDRG